MGTRDSTTEALALNVRCQVRLLSLYAPVATLLTTFDSLSRGYNEIVFPLALQQLTYDTRQEIQVIAPPNRQVYEYTGAPCGGPESFVTQHAQSAEHEVHTSGGKGGAWPAPRNPSAFLRQPRSSAQSSTLT